MNRTLEVRETTSLNEITSILLDDEIYERLADDDCPKREDFQFMDPFHSQYFGGYVDGQLMGMIIHHDGKIHVNILKDFRKEYKSEFLRKALSMIDRSRIYAEIPDLYPSIIAFAKSEGFREESVIKNKFRKNGVAYDTHIMVYEK